MTDENIQPANDAAKKKELITKEEPGIETEDKDKKKDTKLSMDTDAEGIYPDKN